MLKKSCFVMMCLFFLGGLANAGYRDYFKGIRAEAAKVEKLSPADYDLGDKLMVEIRELAKKKVPALPAPIVSFEALSSAGRMWYTNHNYTDRQLFCGRDKWGSYPNSQFQRESHKKTFEIFVRYKNFQYLRLR